MNNENYHEGFKEPNRMKAFTFLGTGTLYESIYTFEGKESGSTQFFAKAIVEFFKPESLFFFATNSAADEPVSDDNPTGRLEISYRITW